MRLFLHEQPYEAEQRDRDARAGSSGKRSRFGMNEEKPDLVTQPLPPPVFLPCIVLDSLETVRIQQSLPRAGETRTKALELAREKKLEMVWVYPLEPRDETDYLYAIYFPSRRLRAQEHEKAKGRR